MTSRPSVPSTVTQRFVNRDHPFSQPLPNGSSTMTIRSVNRGGIRSVNCWLRLSNRHRLIFRWNTSFRLTCLGCFTACKTASTTASSAPLARGLEGAVSHV
jgi:hypothetical protein